MLLYPHCNESDLCVMPTSAVQNIALVLTWFLNKSIDLVSERTNLIKKEKV